MQRYFHEANVSVRRHRWTEVDEADQARADSAAPPSSCSQGCSFVGDRWRENLSLATWRSVPQKSRQQQAGLKKGVIGAEAGCLLSSER